MANIVESSRRTGKTTRLLEEAIRQAASGEYVLVIAANDQQMGYLFGMLRGLYPTGEFRGMPKTPKVYIEQGSISILTMQDESVDLQSGRVRGMHPSCKFFADHFALERFIEQQAGWAWRHWLDQS